MIHKTETIYRTLPLEIICSQLTNLRILGWSIGWSATGNVSIMRYSDKRLQQVYINSEVALRILSDVEKGVNEDDLFFMLTIGGMK